MTKSVFRCVYTVVALSLLGLVGCYAKVEVSDSSAEKAIAIDLVEPPCAEPGSAAGYIEGNGFGAENVTVTVGGIEAEVLVATGKDASFVVPEELTPGPVEVVVTNPGGRIATISWVVCGFDCSAIDCDDGNQCTQDVCDPLDGSCSNPDEADGTACDAGGVEGFFMGLGDLPGGLFGSSARAVSADGSLVVGTSPSAASIEEAFRWENGVMVGLGRLPLRNYSQAYAVSADGSVVVGESSAQIQEAFRWTQSSGMVGMGDLPGGIFNSTARGVSADGSVVVGDSAIENGTEAFRWTALSGMEGIGHLADLGGGNTSQAFAVSADGTVIVGAGTSYISGGYLEAFRWTQSSGMVGLGSLGNFRCIARAVSADGSVIVGESRNALNNIEAFRWAESDGMVGLGDLPGGSFTSVALAVSATGEVIVGHGSGPLRDLPDGGVTYQDAFIWDELNGMRSLQDILISDLGLELAGWLLMDATGISADGRTIVGNGYNPAGDWEAWIAYLGGTEGVCEAGVCASAPDCADAADCDDGNDCTSDVCDPAVEDCVHTPVGDGEACDFGGLPGVCIAGLCEEDLCANVDCEDGDPCTTDSCDPFDGMCANQVVCSTSMFMGVGALPGSVFQSYATAVSADGSVVVGSGRSGQSGTEAFRWEDGIMVGLGDLPGDIFDGRALAVSADGSVVVGLSRSGPNDEAFRWTESDGMVGLGDLPGGIFTSAARGVSADGSVVVGDSQAESGTEPFRWTALSGMEGIGHLLYRGMANATQAFAVSADGLVIVGTGFSSISGDRREAFRWTQAEGMVPLGSLGNFDSTAKAASADGSVIVGTSRNAANAEEAFRWTEADGMVGLGDLPGQGFQSIGNAVSADGSVVVGSSADDPVRYGTNDHAFIWNELNGIQNLKDVLTDDLGLDLAGWELVSATGVSADGRTIVGFGFNPAGDDEGWIAYLGLPQ